LVESKLIIFFDPSFESIFGVGKKGKKPRLKHKVLPNVIPDFFIFVTQEAVPVVFVKIRLSSSLQLVKKE